MHWPLRRVLVRGPSMVPTLRDGEHVLVWLRRGGRRPGRVVVIELPARPVSIKRVVWIRPEGAWVEGDNPMASTDSRTLGALPVASIRGRVLCRIWPVRKGAFLGKKFF